MSPVDRERAHGGSSPRVSDASRLRERLDARLDAATGTLAGLADETRGRLVRYVELLAKWNGVWNLTAVREPLEMIDRHVMDSLSLLPYLESPDGKWSAGPFDTADDEPGVAAVFDLIDVGSGAGLPVLPIAIARPRLRCLSIERTSKKARFQVQAVLELGLRNVEVRAERVEAVAASGWFVTSRAFTEPAEFLVTASALVSPEGAALVMLGRAGRLPERLPEGWSLERLDAVPEVSGDVERHVAVCRQGACLAESPALESPVLGTTS